MSHFTRLDRASITSVKAFEEACKELGFTDIRQNTTIQDYSGKAAKVDVAASAPGARYSVAIQKNAAGKFDMIADWWGVRTRDRNLYPVMERIGAFGSDTDIQDAFLRTTTKHTLTTHYRRLGFMARVTEDEQHNIKVSLTR